MWERKSPRITKEEKRLNLILETERNRNRKRRQDLAKQEKYCQLFGVLQSKGLIKVSILRC